MTNEGEFIDINNVGDRFTKIRTQRCEDLMIPEARVLIDLPLDEKIKKSKEIIKEAIEKFPNIGLGFSGGTDSLILLHITLQIKSDIPIVFVDTQHEFPETYQFIEKIRKDWRLTKYTAVMAEKNKFEEFKQNLGLKTPEFTTTCCDYHKISPMMKAIGDFKFGAFLVGLRGVEHEERAKEVFFSPRKNPAHFRVHPLLFWRREDIMEYVNRFNIECNPIYKQGYTSLGCTHCTEKNLDPNAHERAGRGIVREIVMDKLRALGYT
ncbi:MAG: phosphoadenosine phosphosulfate reductase family protein [Nanoarchaeota archaeon]|nr:phosphoadenosine phosphosulfate reductase family protein [Nanoarchaeota archaeon]